LIEEKYKNFHEIRDEKTKSSKIDKIVKEQARVEELNSLINDFLS